MKKHFGEHTFQLRATARKNGISIKEVSRKVMAAYEEAKSKGVLTHRCMMDMHGLALEEMVLDGKATHFFIETEELARALPLMVKDYEKEFLDIVLDQAACAVIHTTGEKPQAILFEANRKRNDALVVLTTETIGIWYGAKRQEDKHPPELLPILDMVFGMCLYLKCFPHALRAGFPDFAKHPSHYNGNRCIAVGAVPEITDRSGPIPHFRHGHFRLLRDARLRQ